MTKNQRVSILEEWFDDHGLILNSEKSQNKTSVPSGLVFV